MDLYSIIAGWTGWPVIVAVLILAGGYIYAVVNSRLELIKEKNEWLEAQISNLKEYSPDLLAQRLADRLRIANEELERLNADHLVSKEVIKKKQFEQAGIKAELRKFNNQLEKGRELLKLVSDSALICSSCGAPLLSREYHQETVEYNGTELDVDHERIMYECGLQLFDGEVVSDCANCGLRK
jgi:hypothetical protein